MKPTRSCSYQATRIAVCRPLCLALLLLSMTAVVVHAQLPNPVAYLKFDEGSGASANDSSGNNRNAALIGSAGWTTGLVGPFALNLPGVPDSYAQIPGDVLDTTKSYTVAAWVKLNSRWRLSDLRQRRWCRSKRFLPPIARRQ